MDRIPKELLRELPPAARDGVQLDAPPSPERLAITRIVDDEASEVEWNDFCARADRTPMLWRDLGHEQWMARSLSRAVTAHVHDAGVRVALEPHVVTMTSGSLNRGGWSRSSWAGWMAAACLAGAWVVTDSLRTPFGGALTPSGASTAPNPAGSMTPGVAGSPGVGASGATSSVEPPTIMRASLTPDEALDAYFVAGKADGSVLGEVPGMPVVDRRAAPDGGYDVIYLRQILERRRVPAFFTFEQTDEFGRAIPTPVQTPVSASPRDSGSAAF